MKPAVIVLSIISGICIAATGIVAIAAKAKNKI